MKGDPVLDSEFSALREAFERKLSARIDAVAAALAAARGSHPSEEAHVVAKRLAHNLQGTAASYGFAPVSVQMQRVVESLDALRDDSSASAESLWRSIAEALEQARSVHS